MANINSVITYNANLSPAQAQLKALTGQVGALTAAFNTLDKSALSAQRSLATTFAANAGQIGGFTAQTVKANNAVETFGKNLAANRLTMREYFREALTGYRKQATMLRGLAEQQVRYQQSVAVPTGPGQAMIMTPQSINAASSAAQLASQRFSIFNQLVNGGATAMLNWGKNTQWAGRQLMVGFTVPLMLFTAVASKQFRELDKELTRFQKVYGSDLGGAISDSTQRMRDQVQQLAYDISRTYGIAAKDTAALAADIAATGAEGEQLMASIQQTTRLAVLGEVDRQEAMKATLALQSAFRMNTNELAESINFLNAVENQTSATLEDLATAIPKVGPVVRSLGGDIEDLATLLVAMREGGIPAAEAANALKSGLASLINPTKQASEVAKQFGVDLVGIVNANRGQLMPTIYAMQDALNGLDSFSRSKIIEQIFGKYQFARITALFDNIGRTGSQTQSVIELASKSSAELAAVANQEIRTLTESTAVKFQRTLEELKNSIIPIGQTLTETLIPIFEFIGKGMQAFTSFFQALPEPVKNFAKYGVAIAALAGPIIMLVGLFGNLIANGIKFGMMLTRLGARIAGIKTEKFQLLNADVMAAKLGVDNLTTSFNNQETSMKRLVGVMSAYEQSLRRLSTSNPALFIPGAVPGPRGVVPIRRQTGSTSPERVPGGYGGGDKIPALLEPGEMVVRKEAVAQYAPIISAMNRGNLPGYENGKEVDTRHRQRALKSDVFVLRGLGANISSPGGLAGIMSISAKNIADVTSLYVKEIATAAGTSVSAINKEVTAWRTANAPLLKKFNKDFADAVAAGNLPEQQRLIKQVNDKFIRDMRAAGGPVSKFAVQATVMFPELSKDLAQTQSIIQKTKLDLNKAEDAAEFYAKNMSQTALLSRMGQPGNYRGAATAAAGVLPMITGATPKTYLSTYGIPAQFLDPRIRGTGGEASSYGIRSQAGRMALLRAGSSAEHVSKTAVQLETYSEKLLEEGAKASVRGARRAVRPGSPSRTTIEQFDPLGVSLGQGAIVGLTRGYKSAVAGKQIIAGPVGGGGIESISNAQRIVQADQSILKLTQQQHKFTADRVRLESDMAAIAFKRAEVERSRAAGEINIVESSRRIAAIKKEEVATAANLARAKGMEERYQNLINAAKKRILDADQSQVKAEQEETRNVQRRAAMGFGAGPGGSLGYYRTGVSPFAPQKPGSTTFLGIPSVPAKTGPSSSLNNARDMSMGTRGGGVMNAAFMASMAMSSVAMLGGASSDAAAKIGLFSTALMTATMLMQSVSAKGMFTNFLGMGSLGTKMQAAGRGPATNLATGALTKGSALFRAGSAVSMLGGPVGIAAAAGITAAITGFMMYRNAADEARERAIAAFNDPVKSAEYFGETIMSVSDLLEKNRLSNISEDLQDVDQALRDAVSQDYAPLIEQIKFLSAGAGAQQLSVAYSNMILSGMSAENAKAAVEAIAAEAGIAGGEAFNEAMSQGFLDELTTSEAVKRVVGQFNPGQTEYGNTGQSLLVTLTEDLTKLEERKQEIERLMSRGGRNQQLIAEYNTLSDQIDAIADRIEDLSTVNPDMISGVLDSLLLAYQQDPTAAIDGIKELSNTINSLEDEGDRIAALDKITEYLRDSYGEQWSLIGQSIDTANEKLIATQMLAAGISLDRAVNGANEFDAALGQALVTAKLLADEAGRAAVELQTELTDEIVADLESQRLDVETEIQNIEDANAKLIRGYNKRKREAVAAFEAEQESRQENIDSMQDEVDQRRRIFDEEMQQLDDKKEAIDKSSEAYIDSLEKTQKAESFYSQQRKTAFGALEKLASGDVFGFLQERQQMSQDAQEFSYDEMISGIEERRDLELDAIDEVREKKQREQDEYEQMMEDRIKAEQDLMDEQQKAHDAQMEHYEKQIKKAEREKEQKITRKREEIEELNTMQETASRDILEFQKKYAKEYEKYDQYARQLENLKILRTQEIYFRGGVPLSVAANQAGIPASEVPDFLDRNRNEFAFQGTSPGGGGGLVIPSNSTVYISQELPAGPTGAQQVQDMAVNAQNVTINGDVNTPFGSDPNDLDGDGKPNSTDPEPSNPAAATGGYIKNGRVNLQDGGGAVRGPGGPRSDVIPAMLSNGEYVIQASSVNKYGTDLMHSINAGKYAYGGYVSADRAETAAQGNRYGGTPKPKYSGGTPTYSGGYTSANNQATQTSGYKPKVWKQPKIKTGGGFLGDMIFEGMRSDFADFINTTILGSQSKELQNLIGTNISGNRFYGQRSETDQAIGNASFGMNFLPLPGLAMLPKVFSMIGKIGPSLSKNFLNIFNRIPELPTSAFKAGTMHGFRSSQFEKQKQLWMNQSFPRMAVKKELESGNIYGSEYMSAETKAALLKSIPLTSRNPMLFHGSPNPVARFSTPTKYQLEKVQLGPYGIYNSDSLYATSTYAKGSTNYVRPGSTPAVMMTNDPIRPLNLMPYGKKIPSKVLDAIDSRMSKNTSLNKFSRQELDVLAKEWDRVGNSGVDRIHFINDLAERYVPEGMTVQDAQMSGLFQSIKNEIGQGILDSGRSSIRHLGGAIMGDRPHSVNILLDVEKYKYNPFYRMPKMEADSLMANGGLVQKFAEGGLAAPDKGLFGILSKVGAKEKKPAPTTGSLPGTGTFGQPTSAQPTSTSLIGHPSEGGPNKWPYYGYPQGSAKVPGTGVTAHLNKDVLPLFLAFASDYHRLIKPITTLYGIGSRDGNYSNHPSGTAIDINPNQEGVYFGWDWVSTAQKLAVLDWWRGKKSNLAPWKSNSPVPYRTMNALIDKYKVLQWFGPRTLGGFITDEMGNSDPMHVQITQSRAVSPREVSSTISSLGINPDGTFNRPSTYAAGGFISGPGGPRSDIIPAMLSNGEYVVKASSVAKYGKGFMDQINAGQFGMGGLATTAPRMVSPVKYAGGGFVGSMPAATPTFGIPQMETVSPASMNANIANSYGGSNSSSVRNSSKVNIVINGAGGKSANAIANKVISMINQANGRRNHSRSAG